jgi:hypothetical protein
MWGGACLPSTLGSKKVLAQALRRFARHAACGGADNEEDTEWRATRTMRSP